MNVGSNLLQQWVGCNTNDQFLDLILTSENPFPNEEKQIASTREEKALKKINHYLEFNKIKFNNDDLPSLSMLREKVLRIDPSSNNETIAKIDSIRGIISGHGVSPQYVDPLDLLNVVEYEMSIQFLINQQGIFLMQTVDHRYDLLPTVMQEV